MERDWNKVGEKELKGLYYDNNMSDNAIADMYGVTATMVRYKRNKYNISMKQQLHEEFINRDRKIFSILNEESKKRLLNKDKIDVIAKAFTHYIFRDGPIEDMHANNQLSQADMKKLNKFIVNRVSGLLITGFNEEWLKIELLINYYRNVGREWDEAEPETEILDALLDKACQGIF